MEAKNSSNRITKQTKKQRSILSTSKTTDVKQVPNIPNTDQELKNIVRKAFPTPIVPSNMTASILEQIRKK